MKKLLTFLVLIVLFASCTDTAVLVEPTEQDKVITVELQKQAATDTVLYKIIADGDKLTVLSQDNIVVAKAENDDKNVRLLVLISLTLFWYALFITLNIFSNN